MTDLCSNFTGFFRLVYEFYLDQNLVIYSNKYFFLISQKRNIIISRASCRIKILQQFKKLIIATLNISYHSFIFCELWFSFSRIMGSTFIRRKLKHNNYYALGNE